MYYRNPLSDARRAFLYDHFSTRFELDEEAAQKVTERELKVRQGKLNQLLDYLG